MAVTVLIIIIIKVVLYSAVHLTVSPRFTVHKIQDNNKHGLKHMKNVIYKSVIISKDKLNA